MYIIYYIVYNHPITVFLLDILSIYISTHIDTYNHSIVFCPIIPLIFHIIHHAKKKHWFLHMSHVVNVLHTGTK